MDTGISEAAQDRVAPGLQNVAEIVPLKPMGKFGAGGPPGNQKGRIHGAYSPRLSAEEELERSRFEAELLDDLGGEVSAAQRALIRRASFLEIRLRRCERADRKRLRIADEHVLAWINSQRLLLCALGLERKKKQGPDLQDYLKQKAAQEMPEKEKIQ